MHRLKEAMMLLIANDAPLGAEWLDHPLKGNEWMGHRECHIGGDFLLAYKVDDDSKNGLIVFVRAGTHTELFGG
jgi:mRNA interferase YafQ